MAVAERRGLGALRRGRPPHQRGDARLHRRPVASGAAGRHRAARARGPAPVGRARGRRRHPVARPPCPPIGDGFIAVGSSYYGGDAEPIILDVARRRQRRVPSTRPTSGPGIQQYDDVCVDDEGNAVVGRASGGTNGAYDVVRRGPQARGRGRPPAARSPAAATSGPTPAPRVTRASSWWAPTTAPATATPGCGRPADGLEWTEVESSILGGTGDQWASAVAPVPGRRLAGRRHRPRDGRRRHRPVAHRLVGRRHPPRPRRAGPAGPGRADRVVDRRSPRTATSRWPATTTAEWGCGSRRRSTADAAPPRWASPRPATSRARRA